MSNLPKLRLAALNRLFDWSIDHLYLSPANILAALIALIAATEVIESCTRVNQLELGILTLPFVVCLDILFIFLVASLFVRRPSGFCLYLGFVAILIVPKVASIVVIDVLRSFSEINNVPDVATTQLIESSSILVLSLVYFWDIVNRMREAKQCKATS